MEKYVELREEWLKIIKEFDIVDLETNEASLGSLMIFGVEVNLSGEELNKVREHEQNIFKEDD